MWSPSIPALLLHIRGVRATSLIAIALLGDGSTLHSGSFKDEVKKTVRWLMRRQDACGLFTRKKDNSNWLSDHALATYAVAIAAGLSNEIGAGGISRQPDRSVPSISDQYAVLRDLYSHAGERRAPGRPRTL